MAGIVVKREAIGQNVFPGQRIHLPNTFDDKSTNRENPYSVSELPGNSRRECGPVLKANCRLIPAESSVITSD